MTKILTHISRGFRDALFQLVRTDYPDGIGLAWLVEELTAPEPDEKTSAWTRTRVERAIEDNVKQQRLILETAKGNIVVRLPPDECDD